MAHVFRGLICIGLCGLLFSCGGTASFSSTTSLDSGSSTTGAAALGSNITAMSLDGSSTELTIEDVDSDEDVVVVIFPENSSSTSAGFQISGTSSSSSESTLFSVSGDMTGFSSGDEDAVLIGEAEDMTHEFHDQLRGLEEDLDEEALLSSNADEEVLYSVSYATVGDEETFKVLDSFSSSTSYTTVTATLMYQTDDFNFYLDNDADGTLSESNIETLCDNFQDVLDTEHTLFGEPSDVNSDGRFDVLATPIVNELTGGSGSTGIVTGFFYAVDLFSADTYAISNEREIFYTFVPDEDGTWGSAVTEEFAVSNILKGVLPHEYQHMISYNQHVFENSGSSEKGWLNEALAHLAEDIYDIDSNNYMTTTGNENPARIATYLSNIDSTCFLCGTSLQQRGGSYLFMRYLYEQAEQGNLTGSTDGAEFIQTLLDTSERGVDNVITAALGSSGTEDEFWDLVGQFALAVYISDTGLSSSEVYNFDGIDLRATQSDNRSTVLNGPAVTETDDLPHTDSLTGNSILYLQISGEALQETDGEITVTNGSSQDLQGYIIRE